MPQQKLFLLPLPCSQQCSLPLVLYSRSGCGAAWHTARSCSLPCVTWGPCIPHLCPASSETSWDGFLLRACCATTGSRVLSWVLLPCCDVIPLASPWDLGMMTKSSLCCVACGQIFHHRMAHVEVLTFQFLSNQATFQISKLYEQIPFCAQTESDLAFYSN